MLEQTAMTDKYRSWIEAVSAQFGGLDLCALEVLVARDGREIVMELNDCALPLLGDSQEEDRRLISELVLHRMNVSHTVIFVFSFSFIKKKKKKKRVRWMDIGALYQEYHRESQGRFISELCKLKISALISCSFYFHLKKKKEKISSLFFIFNDVRLRKSATANFSIGHRKNSYYPVAS